MAGRSNVDRVEFFRGEDGLWYFRRVAANNEIVASSEGYEHRRDAQTEAATLFGAVAWFERGAEADSWVELDRAAEA